MAKTFADEQFAQYSTVYFAVDPNGVGAFYVDAMTVSKDDVVRWILAENLANYDRILPPTTEDAEDAEDDSLLWLEEGKVEAFVTENEVVEDNGLEYSLPGSSMKFLRRLKPGPTGNLWFAIPAELEERDSLSTLVKPLKKGKAKQLERAIGKWYPKPRKIDSRLEALQRMCHAVIVREHGFYINNQPTDDKPTHDDLKSWIADAESACALVLGQSLPKSANDDILELVGYFGSFLYQSFERRSGFDAQGTLDDLNNPKPSKKAKKIAAELADLEGPDLTAIAEALFELDAVDIELATELIRRELVFTNTASEILEVSTGRIRQLARRGEIGVKADGQNVFFRSKLEQFGKQDRPTGRPKDPDKSS